MTVAELKEMLEGVPDAANVYIERINQDGESFAATLWGVDGMSFQGGLMLLQASEIGSISASLVAEPAGNG